MRSRQLRVASTGEILRAAIALARVWIVQSVTRLGWVFALERQYEAGRLLGDCEVGRDPLDSGREACDVRAHTVLRGIHGR